MSIFRYRLDTLIKLRAAERDALKGDAERAAERARTKARECDDLARAIKLAESELRELTATGAELALDAQLRARLYLQQQGHRSRKKQGELDDAVRAMDAVISALKLKIRDTKALESHRDRKRRQFEEAEGRVSMHAADEQWLRRRRDR